VTTAYEKEGSIKGKTNIKRAIKCKKSMEKGAYEDYANECHGPLKTFYAPQISKGS
jgi:hypothetical protein